MQTGTLERQNNFNLLRLLLALFVILSHSPELTDGDNHREPLMCLFDTIPLGFLAVDGFFLLSGYLIVQSWDLDPRAWPFLQKRILRIYPGFLAASLLCAVLVGPLGADPAQYIAEFDIGAFAVGALLLQSPVVPPVFEGTHLPKINLSMWTIAYEFACYLLVLVAGITGALRIRYFWLTLTLLVFATLIASRIAHFDTGYLRLPSFFLSGACIYMYRKAIRLEGKTALVLALVLVTCMFSWSVSELALATAGAYALIYAATRRTPFLNRFNRLPDISYGTYLYAWPIQKLLIWYFPGMSPWLVFAIAAPAAASLGVISWYVIEKPALQFSRSRKAAIAQIPGAPV